MFWKKPFKIRTKLFVGFFLSIFLLVLANFFAIFLITKISDTIYQASIYKEAIDDIIVHSGTMVSSMFLYLVAEPGELPSLEAEYRFSMSHFHHSMEALRTRKDIKKYLDNIENNHQRFMDSAEKLIDTHGLRIKQKEDLSETVKNLKENRHKIIDNTKNASERLKLNIAQMGYKEKEFLFQYQDKKSAEQWSDNIENVINSLKEGEFNYVLVLANTYFDLAERAIQETNSINDLKLKEKYYLDIIRGAEVEFNISEILISNIIDKELTDVLRQGNFQRVFAFGIILLSILFGSLIVFSVSGGINRSLEELVRVAQKVSSGNLTERAKIQSADEVGYLAAVFNQMLDDTEKSRLEIEAANQQLRASEQQLRASNQQLRASEQQLRASNQQLRATTQALEEERASLEIRVRFRTKEISEEHGKMHSLIESIRLGVILTDQNLKIILVNSAAKSILGKSPNKPITFEDLEKKLKGVNLSQVLSFPIKSGKSFSTRDAIIGNKFYHLFISSVQNIEEKSYIGMVIILEDITEEKLIAKMRSEIISITSHQLRTPLSVIKGNLEMVLEGDAGKITKEQKEILGEVFLGNERMIKLVNALMDVSKIEEGSLEFQPIPTKLEDLVAESVKELLPFAQEKKVLLSYNLPSISLPKVNIDSQRIKQVIQNLIDNAIKYSQFDAKGKVMVGVQKDKTGKFLKMIVKDNGVGIPKDEQGNIFKRFFRASNVSRFDPGGGTGLGLYIAKAVIEQSGGKIWFESGGKGRGTTFFITLPYG